MAFIKTCVAISTSLLVDLEEDDIPTEEIVDSLLPEEGLGEVDEEDEWPQQS